MSYSPRECWIQQLLFIRDAEFLISNISPSVVAKPQHLGHFLSLYSRSFPNRFSSMFTPKYSPAEIIHKITMDIITRSSLNT